ncbi:MAG TPA: hypothetical protein VEL28_14975 [Candidatus Binatia bacterium]|nr:hypothetical protein [Candidatus Binatia bacterium]
MTDRNRNVLLASAVVGLLASTAAGQVMAAGEAEPAKVHCYGINACKGTGDCSGKGHQCAGLNACKGQGHINLPKELCLRIQNGHLVAGPGEEG